MSHPSTWLKIRNGALYCLPGEFYIDPPFPVESALITHAHRDHVHPNLEKVLATPETLAIMQARYGQQSAFQTAYYHQSIQTNGVNICFLPAGHILGSAQISLEYKGKRVIVSGDYKRRSDPTCLPFVATPCDIFITEATFGLPVFQHPPIEDELRMLLTSLQENAHRCHLLGAYPLGKCQRLILTLRQMGYQKPIYLHGAMQNLCSLYSQMGFDLGELVPVTPENAAQLTGELVLCPPMALRDRWTRRLPNVLRAYASGFMKIRARAKQKGIELPLVISDHADWDELIQTITEINAPEVWITHGNEEALIYAAEKKGYRAKALSLLNEETDDA